MGLYLLGVVASAMPGDEFVVFIVGPFPLGYAPSFTGNFFILFSFVRCCVRVPVSNCLHVLSPEILHVFERQCFIALNLVARVVDL